MSKGITKSYFFSMDSVESSKYNLHYLLWSPFKKYLVTKACKKKIDPINFQNFCIIIG